jgi:alkylhydroperoxidase family enzyme
MAASSTEVGRVTRNPDKMNEEDVSKLRKAGFSDEEILSINLITAYFNFVNRIALGLGVQFTPEEATGYEY